MFAFLIWLDTLVGMSAGVRLQHLEAIDIESMSAGNAHAALRDVAVIRGATDRLEAALARRVSELHEQGQAPPVSDLLGRVGRTSRKTAERVERRSTTLGAAPHLNNALGAGKIAAEHADAVSAAAARLDDDQRRELFDRDRELTELAASRTPERFRRELTKVVDRIIRDDGLDRTRQQAASATLRSGVDDDSGMHWFRAELAPEDGNRLRRRIDHETNAIAKLPEHAGKRRDQLEAVALVNLVTGARAANAGPQPADVVILIDYDKFLAGAIVGAAGSDGISEYSDGTPIPVETVRRHACDANIIPVVLGGHGMPLDVGRARRLATPSQRSALRSMYRTCAIDGCDRHFDRCHIHHLLEWDDDGFTDLENLLPLCSFHHHRAHEGRWRLQLDPSTRQLTVHLPDGTLHSTSRPDMIEQRPAA